MTDAATAFSTIRSLEKQTRNVDIVIDTLLETSSSLSNQQVQPTLTSLREIKRSLGEMVCEVKANTKADASLDKKAVTSLQSKTADITEKVSKLVSKADSSNPAALADLGSSVTNIKADVEEMHGFTNTVFPGKSFRDLGVSVPDARLQAYRPADPQSNQMEALKTQ